VLQRQKFGDQQKSPLQGQSLAGWPETTTIGFASFKIARFEDSNDGLHFLH
jgi:hypothetical protein